MKAEPCGPGGRMVPAPSRRAGAPQLLGSFRSITTKNEFVLHISKKQTRRGFRGSIGQMDVFLHSVSATTDYLMLAAKHTNDVTDAAAPISTAA